MKSFGKVSTVISCIGLALPICFLIFFWTQIVVKRPIDFWGIPWDSPIMSLSHAINIDFWLIGGEKRELGTPQLIHPGLIYQVISWVLYRLTSGDITGSPLELFQHALIDPSNYWGALQYVPLFLSILSIALIWQVSRQNNVIIFLAAIASYFIASPTARFGVYDFFNESSSLLMASVFFIAANHYFKRTQTLAREHVGKTVLFGFIGSLMYMHKMNYVIWALSAVSGFIVLALLDRSNRKVVVVNLLIYLGSLVAFIVILSALLFGDVHGVIRMLKLHVGLIAHSGVYWAGPRDVFSVDTMVNAFRTLLAYHTLFVYFGLVSLALISGTIFRKRKDAEWLKKYLPAAAVLTTALLIMTLAILKHLVPYYIVSIAAIYPFILLWLANSEMKRPLIIAAPLILIAAFSFFGPSNIFDAELRNREGEMAYAKETLEDVEKIKSEFPLGEKNRFWMYRIIAPEFQRIFIVEFTSRQDLYGPLHQLQGNEYQFSPWHGNVYYDGSWSHQLKDVPWKYLVADTSGLSSVNRAVHEWLDDPSFKKVKYKRLTLIINPQL